MRPFSQIGKILHKSVRNTHHNHYQKIYIYIHIQKQLLQIISCHLFSTSLFHVRPQSSGELSKLIVNTDEQNIQWSSRPWSQSIITSSDQIMLLFLYQPVSCGNFTTTIFRRIQQTDSHTDEQKQTMIKSSSAASQALSLSRFS